MTLAKFALTAAAIALLAGAPLTARADGGGGGGGAMGPAAPATPRQDPAVAYQNGIAALQAQNYREAIRQLRNARRAAPNDGAVNYALGVAYIGAGETEDARGALERAVRASNAPAGAFWQLGLVYLELDRRDDAIAQQAALQQRIAACDAECGDARRGELQTALDQLTLALNPAPAATDPATTGWNFPNVDEGRAAYAEAVGLINQERFADAYYALTRAEAAVGPHPDVLNYMGFVSRKLGRLDDALGYYHAALAVNPDHLGANEYLGELYIQMGDIGRARTQLARLDQLCAYGCEQREDLARWIETAGR